MNKNPLNQNPGVVSPENRIFAKAKANLYLEILGKRNDGFHDIFSVFVPVDWSDSLEFTVLKRKKVVFQCSDSSLEKKNTVLDAAKALLPFRKNKQGVQIRLEKQVPYQAGLGSASSDAAVALLWLNDFWQCGLNRNELLKLSEKLGSDVPFFLYGSPCQVEGRGERISPVKTAGPLPLLIMKPRQVFISTPEAYALLAQEKAYSQDVSRRTRFLEALQKGDLVELAKNAFNGFEEPLSKKYGFIRHCKAILKEAGALNSILSGSGSALVGFFQDFETLEKGISFFYQKNLKEIFDFKISFL